METKKSLSAIYIILNTVVLSSFLIFVLSNKLQAEQELKSEISPKQVYAYLFPAKLRKLVEQLQQENIEVCELREDIELDVAAYRIERIVRDEKQAQKQRSFRFIITCRQETKNFQTGTFFIKMNQKLGDKVKGLLEPTTPKLRRIRRLFGRLKIGDNYPIFKLETYTPITHGPVRPLKEKREFNKTITFETIYDPNEKVNFRGSPVSGLIWLEDGEHYLQVRDGRIYKVHSESGRSTPFFNRNELAKGLKSLSAIDEKTANSLSKRKRFTMNPNRSAVLIDYENDLYYCTLDGKTAVRLTSNPDEEKLSSFGPGGKFVAFVRNKNLFVVDIATQTERALTSSGGGTISNGEADWVYLEEVYGRPGQAYWWNPDSSTIAFIQFDDGPVNKFTVVNNTKRKQEVEETPYPRAGEPNPKVRAGVVSVAGGSVRWIELNNYIEGTYLITGIGWMPDSEQIFLFVQDRAQTWLDFNTVSKQGGEANRLLRETTNAWVDVPNPPKFLSDGSFLWFSQRNGWKHLYLYDKEGMLKHAVTKGKWEARWLHHVDEKNGWIYFTGTRDSHIADNLYRAKLSGGKIKRLTKPCGNHRINISPNGKYFIDTWSSISTPTKVVLYNMKGKKVRMLDTNPVYKREEYQFGTYEQFQIETKDGFLIEASLVKPPDFDSNKKYPVWFKTYGGPHARTIRNT